MDDEQLRKLAQDSNMDQAKAGTEALARMVASSVITYHQELATAGIPDALRYDLVLQYAEIYSRRFYDQMGFGKAT